MGAAPAPEEMDEIVENAAEEVVEEVRSTDWMIPVPAAQQIFSLVPAVAGGLAGMILAYKFTQSKAIAVRASEVMWATALSFAASFAAVFLMRTFVSYED